MDQRSYLTTFRRHWLLIVITAALGLAVGAVVTVLTPAQYASSVTFFVKTPSTQLSGAFEGDQFGQRRVNSYVELLGSERLAQRVSDDLATSATPVSAGTVMAEIEADADPNTVLTTATITDSSQERSLAIADAVSRQFVQLVAELESPTDATTPTVNLEITSGPAVDPTPVAPRPLINLTAALLAAIALGMIIALLRDKSDTRIRSVDELARLTGLPVLGVIPQDRAVAQLGAHAPTGRRSALAESFRHLRINVTSRYVEPVGVHSRQDASIIGEPASVLAVTSPAGGEGRSSVAAQLAMSFADAGHQVLLVDADLHAPGVSDQFGMANAVGFSDVLVRGVPVQAAVQRQVRTRLSLLASGLAGDLTGEQELRTRDVALLLQQCRRDFEVVVIDTPALLATADAAIVASLADAAVLVVRHGRTTQAQVRRARSVLSGVTATVLGSVLASAPRTGVDRYEDGAHRAGRRRTGRAHNAGPAHDTGRADDAAGPRRPVAPATHPAAPASGAGHRGR